MYGVRRRGKVQIIVIGVVFGAQSAIDIRGVSGLDKFIQVEVDRS
jgi:hypothetical protein